MRYNLVPIISIFAFAGAACAQDASQASTDAASSNTPICGADEAPYRDLDFLVGEWEFFTNDGRKIADQTYSRREQGCLILEDWRTLSGETGTGMNFVDPATGKWRQVWMSPRFHIDYSGGLNDDGQHILEGTIYPNNGQPSMEIRGIYTRLDDGAVTKEFLTRASSDDDWSVLFAGVSLPVKTDGSD